MRTRWIDELATDLRYAVRLIGRSPAFALMAIVSLALGIGANTAIFTLIDVVVLRTLPVRAPEQLVSVGDAARPTALREGGPMLEVLSYPLYARLREQNRAFTGLLASGRTGRIEMRAPDGAIEEVRGRLVSGNYFDVLGVSPAIGRTFAADEDRVPGASPVVVISHDWWERRFARDPGVLGRTVTLNGSPFTIVGVGPRRFTGDVVGSPTEIWIPLTMQAQLNPGSPRLERRDSNWLLALGRLRPGVTIETARAEMTRLAQEALVEFMGATTADAVRAIRSQSLLVQPGGKGFSWVRKNLSPLLWTLMGVVGLVLIIACANVANLFVARAVARQREISVRLAMGARRGRVVRQLVTEGAVLAGLGGVAGLLLAGWGSTLVTALASRGGPNAVPFDVDVRPNVTVLAFTATVSLLTALLFALAPALRSTRVELASALKGHARSLDRGGWSLGRLLVIGQLALSVPLLAGAGLFVRSLVHLQTLDVGYSRDRLLLLKADLGGSHHATAAAQSLFARRLIEHLGALPGVAAATVSENGLFSGIDSSTTALRVDGFQPTRADDGSASFDQVGPRYFQVVGVPVLAGRDFDERDTLAAPRVAIVNETMARFYFGTTAPIGRTFLNGGDRFTIVGIVKDNRQRNLRGRTERRFYLPLSQGGDVLGALNVAIRTRDDAGGLVASIRRELQAFDGGVKVASLEPVRVLMDQSIAEERMIARLSASFGLLALLLAAAGLYGVMSYATSRRTSEIGLRMALGADRRDVIRMVLGEALLLMAGGLAIGLPAALIATRLIAATLAGVGPSDPATLGAALLVMLTAGLAAGIVPARRAARIDPMAALRQE